MHRAASPATADKKGNDSTETVKPSASSDDEPSPGQRLRYDLLRDYVEVTHVADLGEDSDGATNPIGTERIEETAQQIVDRARSLQPVEGYIVAVGSLYKLSVGVIGQYELALDMLHELIDRAHVLLAVNEKKRLLEDDWHLPLTALVNSSYRRYGEVYRVFECLAEWLTYADAYFCLLVDRPLRPPLPVHPKRPDVSLRGHFKEFVRATYQARLASAPSTPAVDTSKNPDASKRWTNKDTVATAKMMREPPAHPLQKNSSKDRRKTHASNADFSFDPISGLGSPSYESRSMASFALGARSLNDALEDARARPELVDHDHPGSFFDPDPTTRAPTPRQAEHRKSNRSSRRSSASRASRASSTGRRSAHSRGHASNRAGDPGPPDDDSSDSSDHRGRGGRRGGRERRSRDDDGGDEGSSDEPRNDRRHSRSKGGLSIDTRVKLDALPTWDGNGRTALAYFNSLNEWARAGQNGSLIHQLPTYAPMRWTGEAQMWWGNSSGELRAKLESSFFAFLTGIRKNFLTMKWAEEQAVEFAAMQFRQRGHEKETPFEFINRRLFLARVLFDRPSSELVVQVLANAPAEWSYLIGEQTIKNTDVLMTRVKTLNIQLTTAYLAGTTPAVSNDELRKRVDALEANSSRQRAQRAPVDNNPFRHAPPGRTSHYAHVADAELEDDAPVTELPTEAIPEANGPTAALAQTVYAFLGSKTRPLPTVFPFPRSTVVSKRAPPSPCKVCGSPKHWDKECGHYQSYLTRRSQNALVATERDPVEDRMYEAVYTLYSNESAFSSCVLARSESAFLSSFFWGAPTVEDDEDEELKNYRDSPKWTGSSILVRADEMEALAAEGARSAAAATTAALPVAQDEPPSDPPDGEVPELLAVDDTDDEEDDDDFVPGLPHVQAAVFAQALVAAAAKEADGVGPPPHDSPWQPDPAKAATADLVIRMPKKRQHPDGRSSQGVTVLTARGRVGSLLDDTAELTLDSGASLTLVDRSFLASLKHPPKVKQGLSVRIAQLTSETPSIEGYVKLPVFIRGEDGATLEFEAEAYVVPNMSVSLLLGEDWHLNYELRVLRSVTEGTRVGVGKSGYHFAARSTRDAPDDAGASRQASRLARSYVVAQANVASFVRAKTHRREKAARRRRKAALGDGQLRAFKDTLIRANSTALVDIAGDLQQGREWFVDRNIVHLGKDAILTVPNCLLSTRTEPIPRPDGSPSLARKSRLPVSNTTGRDLMLRAGTLLAFAKDPSKVLAAAHNDEELASLTDTARMLASLALDLDTRSQDDVAQHAFACRAGASETKAEAPVSVAPSRREEGGARTTEPEPVQGRETSNGTTELPPPSLAEAPNPVDFPSAELEKILDLSPDLPPEVRVEAIALLRKHVAAFGFDGRLGHLATNARIRTKEGTEPIAVPMHGASPEKKQVIEQQIDKWFALDVIEESVSPWAAPVVIVYRNGKARFCVDYRKLNAVTIADEFPIPRQSDILSALSGAQVLSSLDALAGFTQLEVAPEDVEKTAFRTHKGLFQFKRMPFGLRNGPAIFQRVMQGILAPYLWIFSLVYIDDIVIYSATYGEHLEHLDKVLSAITRAGLTLSPDKCHFLYSSILLLGHKVSRLGLSTHEEKVAAIAELEPPNKLSTLQTFLGMVVYFQAFIPYYSFVVAPLFKLLRKDVSWRWGPEEQHAFESAKAALQAAPVLGHPIRGTPYRLYTDASDEALGACLQQVQPIRVGDLAGTQVYERLRRAHANGDPVPQLCAKLSAKTRDVPEPSSWGASFDDTIVYVERVVCYWSRTFKAAERNYSATEREGLAAKEALVKFQPFVEGENVILITDHAALQWARTWENTNRRLAAWGAVFAAFGGLEIVHRAGRLHSNVDPLSRLPREGNYVRGPPEHISPAKDTIPAIRTDVDVAELRERVAGNQKAARMESAFTVQRASPTNAEPAFFAVDDLEAWMEPAPARAFAVQTRNQRRREAARSKAAPAVDELPDVQCSHQGTERPDAPASKLRYEDKLEWKEEHPPPTLLISMSPEMKARYSKGYDRDPAFKGKGTNSDERSWYAGNRFYRGDDGLLYFRDADFMPRLCVPRSERPSLLRMLHESPFESAHAGPEKLHAKLSKKFYWPRMRADATLYCTTCDVCQKNKAESNAKHGLLQPHDIPRYPYERISFDLITGLPWSGLYNAILVVVDLLSKHALFIPTDTGLTTEQFARLFVREVVCKFGLPSECIADRDGRWLSRFFDAVVKQMGVHMLLSSSHHPQHDGQTERTNRTLEVMLRHYVAANPQEWDQWLPSMEFAYNCTTHKSTGLSPYLALYGFQPRSPSSFLASDLREGIPRKFTAHRDADSFLLAIQNHRDAARDAIAAAQHRQAQAYNVGRHPFVLEPGDLVLLKPHSLELVESKGEGVKLVQRALGPYTVQERVSDATYRINLPSSYPMSNVVHARHLRRYRASPLEFGDRAKLPNPRWEDAPEDTYEVERLVAHRRNRTKKQMEYLTRWTGYGPEHDSWLTARELRDAPAVLIDYRRAHGI